MARKQDKGAYQAGNVKCITCSENHAEGPLLRGAQHGMAKLSTAQAKSIKREKVLTQVALAAKYRISRRTVRDIQSGA